VNDCLIHVSSSDWLIIIDLFVGKSGIIKGYVDQEESSSCVSDGWINCNEERDREFSPISQDGL